MTTPLRRAQIVVLAAALLKLVGGLLVWAGGAVNGADYPGAFPPWVHAVHVIAFSAAGLLLIAGGWADLRPRHLGSLFVLLGASFSDRLLVAAAAPAAGPVASIAGTLAILQPEAFIAFVFWRFVNGFPRVEGAPGLQRLIRVGIAISLAAACVLAASNLLLQSPLRNLISLDLAVQLQPLSRMPREGSVFWTVLIVLQIPAYVLMFRKVPFAATGERRRVAMFVAGMVAGAAPMMIDVALESFIPAFARLMNQPTPRMLSGVICYSALLSVPWTTGYAVWVGHVMDVRLVVRKAIQYGLARVTILCAVVLPVAGLGYLLYQRRDLKLGELLTGTQSLTLAAVTLMCIALFRARKPLNDALDRHFFREQYDSREVLARIADRARSTDDGITFAAFVETELDRSIHAERVTVLLVQPELERLASPGGDVRPLPLSGGLVALLSGDSSPLELDFDGERSPLRRLSHVERDWATEHAFRMLVPLLGSDGKLLGAIALGARRSEQAYSQADRLLLSTVAAAAALLFENRALRSKSSPTNSTLTADDLDIVEEHPAVAALQCQACGLVHPREAARCRECNNTLIRSILPDRLNGKFRVRRLVGIGGMAVVYFGTDDGLNRAVALKTLPHISIDRARRLRREARAMASIQHPHLAMIYGLETWHSMPILVVEYFQHGTLADRLRRSSLSAREVRELGLSLARALQYLHGHGLLHRDIKPSNIGLTENDTPKLLDFGLARVIGTILPQRLIEVETSTRTPATSSDGRNLTRSHHVIGTIAYLAPEALRYGPPSTTFDLWSLAVTLYEAFAGTHPFIRASVFETANAIVTREAADIRELRPDCPEGLAELLSDCLRLDASRRPLTADDVTARLEAIAC